MDQIIALTSLPNLHPAIVHFPIVLLNTAVLLDIAALLFSSREWIRKTALLITVLGILFAGLTYWTGEEASESVDLSADAQPVLAEHENLAEYTLWFFGIYTAVRLALYFWAPYKRSIHGIMIALALPGLYLLFQTADHGGALVYKHAVGVRRPPPSPITTPANQTQPTSRTGPVIQGKDFEWSFHPGDEAQLENYFDITPRLQTLNPEVEKFQDGFALTFTKNSDENLQMISKDSYDDAQVEADMDRSELQGKFSLVQHWNGSDYLYFLIDNQAAALGWQGNPPKVFEQKSISNAAGLMKLKFVAAGEHFRAYIDGKLIVHAHGHAGHSGKAGILWNGKGKIRIARFAVHPVQSESH